MIYGWIEAEKARRPEMSISTACRVLGVSRSGFYDWRARADAPPSERDLENAELVEEIRAVHAEFPSYGSPRVHQVLVRRNRCVGRHRVARLMRDNDVRAKRGRMLRKRRTAPPKRRPEVGDLVRRKFRADAPNQLWCVDITQIRTLEGWLCAAVIIDVYSRRIISWTIGDHQNQELAIDALKAAVSIRKPPPGGIVHSDRGYQFTSWEWLGIARAAGLEPSIGRVGSALDNALIEAWFSSFKNEALHPRPMPATRQEARRLLVRHIDFHNRQRLHSALGYRTPIEHETHHQSVSA